MSDKIRYVADLSVRHPSLEKCNMLKTPIIAAVAALVAASSAQAALISYYNFNALSIATASTPGSGGVPTSIAASSGSGSLSLAGWSGLVDDFAGSTINALNSDPSEESLSLVSGGTSAPFPGNGSYLDLTFSTTDLEDVIVTFATRGTASGFNSSTWSYSTDGVNFTASGAAGTATTNTTFALATVDLSSISAIEDATSVTLRYTVSGATSNSGNNRIDNLQINASPIPVPEPASLALIGAASLLVMRRR